MCVRVQTTSCSALANSSLDSVLRIHWLSGRQPTRAMIDASVPSAWVGAVMGGISHCPTTSLGCHQLCGTLHDAFGPSMHQAAERAWTRAISMAPSNAPAYSNRGTARLQAGRCEHAAQPVWSNPTRLLHGGLQRTVWHVPS